MEKLSIKEKAKRYDEALGIAKGLYAKDAPDSLNLERMFPELKESEDEKIRKEIITFLDDVWHLGKDANFDKWGKADCSDWIAWLERQGEQKPVDKVESKFKNGDWCIDKKDGTIFQIVKVFDNAYGYKTIEDKEYTYTHYSLENDARLWTIEDAKDGDVLADNVGIILFRKIGNEKYADVVDYHCAVSTRGSFVIPENFGFWGETKDEQLHPATKEQRDTLMKAMTDAGYEWDAEKLELRKIEAEEELTEQKITGWSKEDNPYYDDISEILINLIFSETANVNKDVVQKDLDWFISLKDRYTWKPSNKQMNALDYYANSLCTYCDRQDDLRSLYNDLKKL